ncbi:MAG: hypothetical protein FVQ85_05565 [Planctomycetes bacterium]|nr:hypothetical protein [Planctomycetota bacterium]
MRKPILALFSLVFCVTSLSWADLPTQLWEARYNSPSNSADVPSALAVDGLGNVYVTGKSIIGSYYDYATIKYDSNGDELWKSLYDGPANESDYSEALTIDDLGNVYVAGVSDGGQTLNDCVTIKYDSNGNELWVASFDGLNSKSDGLEDLVVDSFGNVYVTGYSLSYGVSMDYVTIKYDPNGNELWVSRYNGPDNAQDWPKAIDIDNTGNTYVTGWSGGIGTDYDYATIKYAPDGNELWVARYDKLANRDEATDLIVDDYGNVYVTGYSSANATVGGNRFTTIKYDTNGIQQWLNNSFIGSAGDYDGVSIAVDTLGYVYIAGSSNSAGYEIAKINPYGNTQWTAIYDEPTGYDYATDLVVDDFGNVYVTGYSQGNGTQRDYATVMYDSLGNEQWVTRYDGPPNDNDYAVGLALDNSGNLYVTGWSNGWSNGPTGYDYTTIKYSLYEYCTGPIEGDLNNDCKIDFIDLSTLIGNWLKCNLVNQDDCVP